MLNKCVSQEITHIITFAGKKNAGKDTLGNAVAQFLRKRRQNVKLYAFADDLKSLCMNILLLTHDQCYGGEVDKNTPTKYLWENMPGLSETEYAGRTGIMTARHVLQYVGTNIFRKMYGDIWVESCMNRISKEHYDFAIITDCRFPNEALASKENGSILIRLTRNSNSSDIHPSETSLDKDKFDWANFDLILDNENETVGESINSLIGKLRPIFSDKGWL